METTRSFSWEGEDVLLRKIMPDLFGIERGFYIDIGAHHPFNLSNTHLLHDLGWRGINVDATPGSMALFNEHRPADINLECAVSDKPGKMLFTVFDQPELNGFVDDGTIAYHESRGIKVVRRVEIDCVTLNSICEEYVKDGWVHLLSIDVEGLDLRILKAADLEKWRPAVIVIEVPGYFSIKSILKSPVTRFLSRRDYVFFSRLHFSCMYVDIRRVEGGRHWKIPLSRWPIHYPRAVWRRLRRLASFIAR